MMIPSHVDTGTDIDSTSGARIPSSLKVSSPCPGEHPVDRLLDAFDLELETEGAASNPLAGESESDFFADGMTGSAERTRA
jgi:hypothetical protein